MKIFFTLTLIIFCSFTSFAQTASEKEVSISAKKMKKRILKKMCPQLLENIRNYHGQGDFLYRVKVDENGAVKSAKPISNFHEKAVEYVQKAIGDWRFKPLKIDGKSVTFVGIVQIHFWYGGFSGCD